MKNPITSSVLVIHSDDSCESSIVNQFDLSDVTVSAISNIEQFDIRFSESFFDTIIVGRDLLAQPTNSAMADLQMLSTHTSSLIIADAQEPNRLKSAPIQHQFNSIRSHQARSNQDVALISDAVAGIDHQSRNILQRLQIRLDELRKRDSDSPEMLEFAELFHDACFSINELFQTARQICHPIDLNLELFSVKKIVSDCWIEFSGEPDDPVDSPIELSDLVMVDSDKMIQSVLEILTFLRDSVRDHSMVRRTHWETDIENKTFRAGFEAIEPDNSIRPNPRIRLALSKRIIQLHGGRLEIETGDPSRLSCLITIPVSID